LIAAVDPPEKNTQPPGYYTKPERRDMFKLDGITMPATCCVATFRKFEKQNPEYALTVFECPSNSSSREDLSPVYASDKLNRKQLCLIYLFEPVGQADEANVKSRPGHYITVRLKHLCE
jgi:hypothetical protein